MTLDKAKKEKGKTNLFYSLFRGYGRLGSEMAKARDGTREVRDDECRADRNG